LCCDTTLAPFSGAAWAAQRPIACCQRWAKLAWRWAYCAAWAASSCCRRAARAEATTAMLRGSVWICGLPAAWTSPCERSSTVGTSSLRTKSAAARFPGRPGCTLALPDCCSSRGSQPISSSAPVHTTRSALRTPAIRLGLAWIWCGSCKAVVADVACTSSPPSSCASAAHSGSQANTRSAAWAGAASRASDSSKDSANVLSMNMKVSCRNRVSEGVGAVGAQAHLVLEEQLVVRQAVARVIASQLQAHPREFARIEIQHQRVLVGLVAGRIEYRRVHVEAGRPGVEPFGAQADTPARHELIDALQIPARLRRAIPAFGGGAGDVGNQRAIAPAAQVLALQLEVGARRVAVRRPLVDEVRDCHSCAARERISDRVARAAAKDQGLIGRLGVEHRQTRAPAAAGAEVAAHVSIYRTGTCAIARVVAARERPAAPELGARLQEQVGGRQPAQLQAVIPKLVSEKGLISQRGIDEVPGVRMLLVEVADAREVAARLEGEPIAQAGGLNERLFHRHRVVRRNRNGGRAAQPR